MAGSPEYRKALVRGAIKFGQHGDNPLVGAIVDAFHGAPSPNYLRIPWYEVSEVANLDSKSGLTLEAEADPNARALGEYVYRLRREALVVAAGGSAIRGTLQETQGRMAVAAEVEDIVIAGLFPKGIGNLAWLQDHQAYASALRKGKKNFPIDIGAFIEGENIFVPAPDSFVVKPGEPIKGFHVDNRYTPIV